MNIRRKSDIWPGLRGNAGHRERGLTLIELMIALVLGSMLMIGAVQLFSGMRSAYQLNEGLSRVQESGRFAVDMLTRDLRMAGYMGCSSNPRRMDIGIAPYLDDSDDVDTFYLNFTRGLEGYEANSSAPGQSLTISSMEPQAGSEANWNPALPAVFMEGETALPIPGSDILIMRYMEGDGVGFVHPYTKGNQYHVTDNQDYQQGDLLFAADCQGGGYLFRRNNNPGGGGGGNSDNVQPGSGTDPEYRTFSADAEMARARMAAFFIGVDDADYGRPTLYRRTLTQSGDGIVTDALVSGVENMQVLYGIDQGGNRVIDEYMTAAEVDAADLWFAVSSVRVGLLARSESQVVPPGEQTPKQFSLLGTDVTVDIDEDRRHRQIFVTTVDLRNR